ncbi:hypothetical protein Vretimale_17657 [Volvox reticuliferus]|uniref:Uncharacterized protein n=2 Tax=Volvox reticuliferus TaxID=1737510 RepID=A0A8J4GW51_9CHLO|nr:hypothetical protein Vretimale_17657 [Volvox reticuliferus]
MRNMGPTGRPAAAEVRTARTTATATVPTTTTTTASTPRASVASSNDEEACTLQRLVHCALAYDPRVNEKRARVLRVTACWLATSPRPNFAPYSALLTSVRNYIRHDHAGYWFDLGFDRLDDIGELLRDPAARGIFKMTTMPETAVQRVELDLVALSVAAAFRYNGGVSSVRGFRTSRTQSVPSVDGPSQPGSAAVFREVSSPARPGGLATGASSSGGTSEAAPGTGEQACSVAAAAAWAWPGDTTLPRLRRRAALLLAAVTAEDGVSGQPHTMLVPQLVWRLKCTDRTAYTQWQQTPDKHKVATLLDEAGGGSDDSASGGGGSDDSASGGGGGAPACGPYLRLHFHKGMVSRIVSLDLPALLAAAAAAAAAAATTAATADAAAVANAAAAAAAIAAANAAAATAKGPAPKVVSAAPPPPVGGGSGPASPRSAAVMQQAGLMPVEMSAVDGACTAARTIPALSQIEAAEPYEPYEPRSSGPPSLSTASTTSAGSGDCTTTVWHRMVTAAAIFRTWPHSDTASRVRQLSAKALRKVRDGPMGPWSMLWARMAAHIHKHMPTAQNRLKSELPKQGKNVLRGVFDESAASPGAVLRVSRHVHDFVVQLDVPALLRESLEQCINARWGSSADEGDAAAVTAAANAAKRCVVRLLAAAPPLYQQSFAELGARVLKQCPGRPKLRTLCAQEQDVFHVSLTGKSHYAVRLVDSEILGLAEALAAAEVEARQWMHSGSRLEAAARNGGGSIASATRTSGGSSGGTSGAAAASGGSGDTSGAAAASDGTSGSINGVTAAPNTMQQPSLLPQPPLLFAVSGQSSSPAPSPPPAEASEPLQVHLSRASYSPAVEAPAVSSQPPAPRPLPIPIPIPILVPVPVPGLTEKEKGKEEHGLRMAPPYKSTVAVPAASVATSEPSAVQSKTAEVPGGDLSWLLDDGHPGGEPCSWASEASIALPPVAVQIVMEPYGHEATAMLNHCRACTLVGLFVQSYREFPVLVVLYAPAMAAWPATVYLVDCTTCTTTYDEGGKKMAGELLGSLLEDPAVTKVVHGCQQVRCLETACGGAVIMPLVDTRVLLNGIAFMMGLPPPPATPPSGSSLHSKSPVVGAAPASESRDLRADVTAVHKYVSRMYDKLKEMELWADRPGLLEALMKLHFATLRGEVVAARARQVGDNFAAAAVDALGLTRPLGDAQVAAATSAVVALPEIWMAMVEEAVLWVAVHAPLDEMKWRRGARPPPAAAAAAMP